MPLQRSPLVSKTLAMRDVMMIIITEKNLKLQSRKLHVRSDSVLEYIYINILTNAKVSKTN